MFDFDAAKLLIIGVVALIVIGPKDLPRVLRQVGQAVGRVRRMAGEFQGQFMDAMREADIEAIREDLKKATADAGLDTHFDPARDIQRELTSAVDTVPATPAMSSGEAVAALDTAVPSATDGFALIAPPSVPDGSATLADAGAAPAADLATLAEPEQAGADRAAGTMIEYPAAADAPARKRRIRVARRSWPARRVHDVLDRTGLVGPGSRLPARRGQP